MISAPPLLLAPNAREPRSLDAYDGSWLQRKPFRKLHGAWLRRALNSYTSVEGSALPARLFTNGMSFNAVPELRV